MDGFAHLVRRQLRLWPKLDWQYATRANTAPCGALRLMTFWPTGNLRFSTPDDKQREGNQQPLRTVRKFVIAALYPCRAVRWRQKMAFVPESRTPRMDVAMTIE
jgi:hypothetical protein